MNEKTSFAGAAAIVVAAAILAVGMANITKTDRSVSVRGLAEREVAADMAVWPLSFTLGGNNLATLQQTISDKTAVATQFLQEHGLEPSDFTVQAPAITDNSVNPYMDKNQISYIYIAKATILVRSDKVLEVKNAQADSMALMSSGIAVSQDYSSKISFEFTKLNDIKPDMIADATQNARLAAEQFARDSGSKVGKIKRATQGLFSIEDAAVGLEEKKNVRVVTTVEYALK